MDFLDYVQMSKGQRILYKIKSFFTGIPGAIVAFFTMIGNFLKKVFLGIGHGFQNYGQRFAKGDIGTKLSYIIMGAGNMLHGQIVKGLIFLAVEVSYFAYMIFFGIGQLSKFYCNGVVIPDEGIMQDGVLGSVVTTEIADPNDIFGVKQTVYGDNSMHILLFSVLTILITVAFIAIYVVNTKSAYYTQTQKELYAQTHKPTDKPVSFLREMKMFLDERFHVTLLSLPVILLLVFNVLPIIFTIFMAFTNYDQSHQAPAKLFWWVGFDNFADVFYSNPLKSRTFGNILVWTIIWAIFATFTNYVFGIILALLINKKGIKFKSFWRTMFVITAAVPQFVTLLLMNQLLQNDGSLNLMLGTHYPFLSDPIWAKVVVIVVNMWVGIPYTMLISSGLLMNIPEDLYESARIDGANAFQQFTKITFPYIFFVTTPYLITTFVGNINNFNVIFLLTGGGPETTEYYQAGQTDLLVTWLYKLTVNQKDYNLGAVIGIIVFLICAIGSLITFNMSKASKNEEEFS